MPTPVIKCHSYFVYMKISCLVLKRRHLHSVAGIEKAVYSELLLGTSGENSHSLTLSTCHHIEVTLSLSQENSNVTAWGCMIMVKV